MTITRFFTGCLFSQSSPQDSSGYNDGLHERRFPMRFAITMTLLAAQLWCQDAAKNPQLAGAKAFFEIAKTDVLKSVEKMPEAKFSFRPSDDVRTYGQLLAHVADGPF